MGKFIPALLLSCLLGHPTQAFDPHISTANNDKDSKPFYCFLPLKNDSAKDSDDRWNASATPGVQYIDSDGQSPFQSAFFDEKNLIELDGSSELNSQNLSVELWFRSEQVWNAKYWPGAATQSRRWQQPMSSVSGLLKIVSKSAICTLQFFIY